MQTKDPNIKNWSPPFTSNSQTTEILSCTGKNIADGVESLLGALFLSSNLYKTLKFISYLQLVPLKEAKLLDEIFPDEDLTFKLYGDLDAYGFDLEDTVSDIYCKYFNLHQNSDYIKLDNSI